MEVKTVYMKRYSKVIIPQPKRYCKQQPESGEETLKWFGKQKEGAIKCTIRISDININIDRIVYLRDIADDMIDTCLVELW